MTSRLSHITQNLSEAIPLVGRVHKANRQASRLVFHTDFHIHEEVFSVQESSRYAPVTFIDGHVLLLLVHIRFSRLTHSITQLERK